MGENFRHYLRLIIHNEFKLPMNKLDCTDIN